MGSDLFEIAVNTVKVLVIFVMMVQLVPLLVWVERRGSAFIQSRLGPNRVGPLGLTQLLADAVKFLGKEEFSPGKGKTLVFYAAPVIALVPAAIAFSAIPIAPPVKWDQYIFLGQGFQFGVGIVFVLGVSSLAAYALLMAGWGSTNKYSMMGALRASAQAISYELALGLALVGAILCYGTFDFSEMIRQQQGGLSFQFMGHAVSLSFLPNWGIFYQPLGALIYFAAIFAETNRLPFDLPEAEGELVAGYHTEYGGLKMLLFYIGEYGHMLVGSALMTVFYFGGYDIPFLSTEMVSAQLATLPLSANLVSLATALVFHVAFMAKVLFFLWVFIWVRWTLPRFRYDQLMDLGWKTMLPWALGNTIVTAVVIVVARL
jgi:NADH-quinone oxidoreductase subunit H